MNQIGNEMEQLTFVTQYGEVLQRAEYLVRLQNEYSGACDKCDSISLEYYLVNLAKEF